MLPGISKASHIALGAAAAKPFLALYRTNAVASGYAPTGKLDNDAAGNFYLCGGSPPASGAANHFILKVDQEGNILGGRDTQSSTAVSEYFTAIRVAANGDIYAVGAGFNTCRVAKFNSSFVHQWTRTNSEGSGDELGSLSYNDSLGAFVAAGTAAGVRCFAERYSSGATRAWHRRAAINASSSYFSGVILEDSGVAILFGRSPSTLLRGLICRLSSTGTTLTTLVLSNASFAYYLTGAPADDGSNAYCGGGTSHGGNSGMWFISVVKSSLAINWTRRYTHSDGRVNSPSESVILDGELVSVGYNGPSADVGSIYRVSPVDGSLIGAYRISRSGYNIAILGARAYDGLLWASLRVQEAATGKYYHGFLKVDPANFPTGTFGGFVFSDVTAGFTEAATTLTSSSSGVTYSNSATNDFAPTMTSLASTQQLDTMLELA